MGLVIFLRRKYPSSRYNNEEIENGGWVLPGMSVERLERSLTTMWRGIMQHLLGRSALRVRHCKRKRCG